jgi:hypothetical protein
VNPTPSCIVLFFFQASGTVEYHLVELSLPRELASKFFPFFLRCNLHKLSVTQAHLFRFASKNAL